ERHAVLVEEAAEIEIETDRTYAANLEAIASKRIRRTAACDPFDAATPALLKNIPHDEEIFFVADINDDSQFLFELGFQAGVVIWIAASQSVNDELVQESGGREVVGRRVAGELRFAEGE